MKFKWSNGLFSVTAVYITSKFYSSTLRQSAAELLLFVQKSKMAAATILNYNFVMLDHPRSPFVHLKFSFKFCVDRVSTFRDIAIRKFRKIGLKCLSRPPKIMFWESFDFQTLFFYNWDPPKNFTFRGNTRFEP